MKLGIFLLIFGFLLLGIGVAAWQYGAELIPTAGLEYQHELEQIPTAAGLAVAFLGTGLIIGGIVRMIVKR